MARSQYKYTPEPDEAETTVMEFTRQQECPACHQTFSYRYYITNGPADQLAYADLLCRPCFAVWTVAHGKAHPPRLEQEEPKRVLLPKDKPLPRVKLADIKAEFPMWRYKNDGYNRWFETPNGQRVGMRKAKTAVLIQRGLL